MKKNYETPELEIKKFDFSEIMTNIDVSQPEDTRSDGFDRDDDDIGDNDDIGS